MGTLQSIGYLTNMETIETKSTLTVQEVIDALQQIQDKSMPIVMETVDFDVQYAITSVQERRRFVELCTCFEKFIGAK